MDAVTIREMCLMDIERVYEIERVSFKSPWSYEMIRHELLFNDVAYYIVAEINGIVVAHAGMWVLPPEAHMTNIAVAPEYRNRGIATRLILALMSYAVSVDARRISLEVRQNNHAAQRVYYSLDFRYVGIKKRYYSDTGENAFILWNESIDATLLKNTNFMEAMK